MTLQLSGDLTIYRARVLKEQLLAAVDAGESVEIDLGAVENIDTAGVQLLLLAKREMTRKGGRLALVNHSASVVDAFDLYGLTAHFGDPVLMHDAAGG